MASTDKSARWAFTAYEGQYSLFKQMPPGVAEWGWNVEICPETNREHYQGYLRLTQQQRFAWVRKNFPGVHMKIARNWEALLNYCKKEETRAPGTEPVAQTNDIPTHFSYADEVGLRIFQRAKMSPDIAEFQYESWDGSEALFHVEAIVRLDIASGRRGLQWIASNPAWKAMWKPYWLEHIRGCGARATSPQKTDRQTDTKLNSPDEVYESESPAPVQESGQDGTNLCEGTGS